ncbi:hypothetical protein AB6A40_010285 [Gnathostoma spinigerum]|uniref:Uncharacterized protein n=1 Tax=Gnathostoma spinigerum TaxID=75299 RepID=A0ABD6F0V2_9BILA
MAKTCRRIEPKPQPMLSLPERTPLLLFSLAPVSAVAVQTAASKSIVIDADSIQKNMLTNREALRSKLACRPSVGCLVQRGILRGLSFLSSCRLRLFFISSSYFYSSLLLFSYCRMFYYA